MTNKIILCDTDFFVALLIKEDTNSPKANSIIQKYSDYDFVYSNLTKYELMTVLSRKLSQELAIKSFELFQDTFSEEFEFDRKLESSIIEYYNQSKNKNQSFFDIACFITAQKFNYKVASFDKFYPQDILIY